MRTVSSIEWNEKECDHKLDTTQKETTEECVQLGVKSRPIDVKAELFGLLIDKWFEYTYEKKLKSKIRTESVLPLVGNFSRKLDLAFNNVKPKEKSFVFD